MHINSAQATDSITALSGSGVVHVSPRCRPGGHSIPPVRLTVNTGTGTVCVSSICSGTVTAVDHRAGSSWRWAWDVGSWGVILGRMSEVSYPSVEDPPSCTAPPPTQRSAGFPPLSTEPPWGLGSEAHRAETVFHCNAFCQAKRDAP